MLYIILASPLLIWLWWGVAFTIIDFALHLAAKQGEYPMEAETQERAKLIRFTSLAHRNKAALVSEFDAEKNILTIDPDNFQLLNPLWQTHLTFSELPAAVVTERGNFEAA